MKIALIGATGYVGSSILTEALNRGHQIAAIVRHPEKLPKHENVIAKKGDVYQESELASLIAGHDAVISAFNAFHPGMSAEDGYQAQLKGTQSIINAVKKAKINRLLMVGGAGSLFIKSGIQLVNTPEFPKEWKEMALSMGEALSMLKKEQALNWTFLSPSALLQPGERTERFRLGSDQLLTDEKGESKISTQDYAVAMINELENPQHSRQRFTVGY